MTITIHSLPADVNYLIFQKLGVSDLKYVARVCKSWLQIVRRPLIIDVPNDLIIDRDITTLGPVLIRAKTIYGAPGVCITGIKVTLVAHTIDHNGPIKSLMCDKYYEKSWVKGPLPGGTHGSFKIYSAQLGFWSKLVEEQKNIINQ